MTRRKGYSVCPAKHWCCHRYQECHSNTVHNMPAEVEGCMSCGYVHMQRSEQTQRYTGVWLGHDRILISLQHSILGLWCHEIRSGMVMHWCSSVLHVCMHIPLPHAYSSSPCLVSVQPPVHGRVLVFASEMEPLAWPCGQISRVGIARVFSFV